MLRDPIFEQLRNEYIAYIQTTWPSYSSGYTTSYAPQYVHPDEGMKRFLDDGIIAAVHPSDSKWRCRPCQFRRSFCYPIPCIERLTYPLTPYAQWEGLCPSGHLIATVANFY